MLQINNLHCSTSDGKEILKGVNLNINPGELHVLMGPNGSGKSTLSKTLMGHPSFEITEGTIELDGEDLTEKEVNERAHSGLFVAYQYPVEVPGVNFSNFLRLAYNSNKSDFPIFRNNPGLIYLDNSATTQKPQAVIASIANFYENYNYHFNHDNVYCRENRKTRTRDFTSCLGCIVVRLLSI